MIPYLKEKRKGGGEAAAAPENGAPNRKVIAPPAHLPIPLLQLLFDLTPENGERKTENGTRGKRATGESLCRAAQPPS